MLKLREGEEGEHAPGAAFFLAVGVVGFQIRCGVFAGVVEIPYSEFGGLDADGGGEIGIVVGRADAGGDDAGEIGGVGAVVSGHFPNRFGEDVEVGSFFPGMEKADGAGDGIGQVNGGAIGYVDGEELAGEIGDEAVNTRVGQDFLRGFFGNDSHPVAVDLLGVVAGFRFGKINRNHPVVVRGEVAQGEFAVTEDIHTGEAWDP